MAFLVDVTRMSQRLVIRRQNKFLLRQTTSFVLHPKRRNLFKLSSCFFLHWFEFKVPVDAVLVAVLSFAALIGPRGMVLRAVYKCDYPPQAATLKTRVFLLLSNVFLLLSVLIKGNPID